MIGTPLLLSDTERRKIVDLMLLAEMNPVDMTRLDVRIKDPAVKARHMAQMTAQTIEIPLAYLVTFSIEHNHPCGTCRHMSMSVQRPGRAPNEHALWMIAQEFGFVGGLAHCVVKPEKLKGHGIAINVIQPVGNS